MQVLLARFKKGDVSEQWSLKAVGYLIQLVSNTGLTVYMEERVLTFRRVEKKGKPPFWYRASK